MRALRTIALVLLASNYVLISQTRDRVETLVFDGAKTEARKPVSMLLGDVPDILLCDTVVYQVLWHHDGDTSVHIVFGTDVASRGSSEEQARNLTSGPAFRGATHHALEQYVLRFDPATSHLLALIKYISKVEAGLNCLRAALN